MSVIAYNLSWFTEEVGKDDYKKSTVAKRESLHTVEGFPYGPPIPYARMFLTIFHSRGGMRTEGSNIE